MNIFTSVCTIWISGTVRDVTSITCPAVLTDTRMKSTVTLAITGTILAISWTTGIFTEGSTPSNITLALVTHNRSML